MTTFSKLTETFHDGMTDLQAFLEEMLFGLDQRTFNPSEISQMKDINRQCDFHKNWLRTQEIPHLKICEKNRLDSILDYEEIIENPFLLYLPKYYSSSLSHEEKLDNVKHNLKKHKFSLKEIRHKIAIFTYFHNLNKPKALARITKLQSLHLELMDSVENGKDDFTIYTLGGKEGDTRQIQYHNTGGNDENMRQLCEVIRQENLKYQNYLNILF